VRSIGKKGLLGPGDGLTEDPVSSVKIASKRASLRICCPVVVVIPVGIKAATAPFASDRRRTSARDGTSSQPSG